MSLRWLSFVVSVMLLEACGGRAFETGGATGGSPGVGGNPATGGQNTGGAPGIGGMSGTGGVSTGITSCSVNSDCVVRPASCCGSCGAATQDDAAAINKSRLSDFDKLVCDGSGCPACYMPSDPSIVANCRSGICNLTFLQQEPYTECVGDGDCVLRTRDCCECGGNTDLENLIALNEMGLVAYPDLVCDANTGCPECLPVPPMHAIARCENLRCVVVGISPAP